MYTSCLYLIYIIVLFFIPHVQSFSCSHQLLVLLISQLIEHLLYTLHALMLSFHSAEENGLSSI